MNITYPFTVENCVGEKLVFRELHREYDGDRLVIENYIRPGKGPRMQTHWLQDKALKVIKGRLGYQLKGEPKKFAEEGEIVFLQRGTTHRIWNAGTEMLYCEGWLKPANTATFFLSSFYHAQNKSGGVRPATFDAAFLIRHYSDEYDIPGMPKFVKKAIMPASYHLGRILGKYKHFENAPAPVKAKKYYH